MDVVRTTAKEEEGVLSKSVSNIEALANSLVVNDPDGYVAAGELLKRVKRVEKEVEAYWKPLHESSYAAYKAVNDHKKAMTAPLKNATEVIKRKASEYKEREERERRQREAELRRLAEEEAAKQLEIAEKAEAEGRGFDAETARAAAEVMAGAAMSTATANTVPKVSGLSYRKAIEVEVTDSSAVPVEFDGIVIRPVDDAAIRRIVNAYRSIGKDVNIPGVTIREKNVVSVRA